MRGKSASVCARNGQGEAGDDGLQCTTALTCISSHSFKVLVARIGEVTDMCKIHNNPYSSMLIAH